jgi:lysozyme
MGLNVNDHHRLNDHGLDLLTEYEKGPQDGSVPLSPSGAALEPYICPGDKLTIGYGCTKWFGGRDVMPSDILTDEAHARQLLAEQLVEYEDAVKRLVTVPLNSNQFSALVCFAFNCGIAGLAGSTLLKHVNASRFDDAADQFGAWLYSTSGKHKQALRGLLRRRYSEALLFMGYSWTVACADDAIAMVREKPPGNVGTDKVLSRTGFKDVLAVAQRYPLTPDDDELVLTIPASPLAADEVAQRRPDPARSPAAGATIAKPSVGGSSEAVSVAPKEIVAPQPPAVRPAPASVPAKVEAKPPEKLAPPPLPKDVAPASIEPKDMVLSKRFWGLAVTAVGTTNFLPRGVSEWINNEGNRELLTWLVVVVIGFALYKYGQRKAKTDLK